MSRMTALEEYNFSRRCKKRIVRHYRRFDGKLACGITTSHLDATGVEGAVTCINCKKVLHLNIIAKGGDAGQETL